MTYEVIAHENVLKQQIHKHIHTHTVLTEIENGRERRQTNAI